MASLPAALHNQYGPTETTVDVLVWDCHERAQRVVPIGRPIDNTCAYVLDPDLQPIPVGVPGELHIGGLALARSYLNRFTTIDASERIEIGADCMIGPYCYITDHDHTFKATQVIPTPADDQLFAIS